MLISNVLLRCGRELTSSASFFQSPLPLSPLPPPNLVPQAFVKDKTARKLSIRKNGRFLLTFTFYESMVNIILYCRMRQKRKYEGYTMKKILVRMAVFTLVSYLWFALLPEITGFSFPTGGWDWLNFIGIVAGLLFTAWGVIETINKNAEISFKQQVMAVKPCLDADIASIFSAHAPNQVFRCMIFDKTIINDGFKLLMTPNEEKPKNFKPHINIKFRNIGLSPAFNVSVSIFKLDSVDGLSSLDQIKENTISNFYDKVHYSNMAYTEYGSIKTSEWIISPIYNLNNCTDELNLVFDTSRVNGEYHFILKLYFEDVYQTKYHQLLYFYINNTVNSFLPISQIYKRG